MRGVRIQESCLPNGEFQTNHIPSSLGRMVRPILLSFNLVTIEWSFGEKQTTSRASHLMRIWTEQYTFGISLNQTQTLLKKSLPRLLMIMGTMLC